MLECVTKFREGRCDAWIGRGGHCTLINKRSVALTSRYRAAVPRTDACALAVDASLLTNKYRY